MCLEEKIYRILAQILTSDKYNCEVIKNEK